MKTLKVKIPEGYEIDKEKSTFETIMFKLAKKELPKSWEDLKKIEGYYVGSSSYIGYAGHSTDDENKNIFVTKEQAEASIALAQLSQLREVYRNGWKPDWTDANKFKYIIEFYDNKIWTDTYTNSSQFLSFQDAETRDLFLENFKELIETAKPLMS
jgi:hypothetical protein